MITENRRMLYAQVSERAFQETVRELAILYGWQYYHTWNSIHSPQGFVDCVLVKRGRLIFAELKTEKGKLTAYQAVWIAKLREVQGIEVCVWRPSDYEAIERVLRDA